MSEPTPSIGSEAKRGVTATALGVALGLLAALFARKQRTGDTTDKGGGRRWRGRSVT